MIMLIMSKEQVGTGCVLKECFLTRVHEYTSACPRTRKEAKACGEKISTWNILLCKHARTHACRERTQNSIADINVCILNI